MAYSLLNQINPTKEDWAIQVRLIRLWEAINFKADNAVLGLEMVFLDSAGGSAQAFIRRNHMRKFKSLLQEGHVYVIRHFKVRLSSLEYKVVPSEHRIYFEQQTLVEVNQKAVEIPMHVFFFVSADTHRQRVNNNFLLTDIIGCVVGLGDVEFLDTEKKRVKRLIELASTSEPETVMKITLWGGFCAAFDAPAYTNVVAPVIAVITSTTIKRFLGDFSYGSTTATRVYFNPDIPEATLFKRRFAGGPHNVRVLGAQQRPIVSITDQLVFNRRTIQEILDMTSIPDTQNRVYTVLATITGIDNTYGWSYASCPCKKKVEATNGAFFCPKCNKECEYPSIRYKIHLKVADAGGATTTFVVFYEEAQKLLGRRATTYVAQLGIGSTQVPADITCLKGKTYVFRLKLTEYNLEDGLENYTVAKIFDVDEAVEKRLSTSAKEKIVIDDKKRSPTVDIEFEAVGCSQGTQTTSAVLKIDDDGSQVETVATPAKKDHKKPRNGK